MYKKTLDLDRKDSNHQLFFANELNGNGMLAQWLVLHLYEVIGQWHAALWTQLLWLADKICGSAQMLAAVPWNVLPNRFGQSQMRLNASKDQQESSFNLESFGQGGDKPEIIPKESPIQKLTSNNVPVIYLHGISPLESMSQASFS